MTVVTDLDDYRASVRSWLSAHLPRGTYEYNGRDAVDLTADDVAAGRALQKRMFEAGYMGITVPTEYGGQGLSADHQKIWQQESEGYLVPMPAGTASEVTARVILPTILHNATEQQKSEWIPRILSGDDIWVLLLSEPDAGSDLAGIRTQARRDGDKWVLSGTKIWSSGAIHADFGLCLARTDSGVPKHRGLTWFKVPLHDESVTVRPVKQINGSEEFCEEFLDDVVLSDDMVIGRVNDGWTVANSLFIYERGAGQAAPPPSTADARREQISDLVALMPEPHEVAGRRNPARMVVAEQRTRDWVHDALGRRIFGQIMAGANPSLASLVKLSIGTRYPERGIAGMEIAGRKAIAWRSGSSPGEQTAVSYLYGRQFALAGGSNQVQRNIISERVLGLPREPSYDNDKPFRDVLRDARNWTTG